MAIYVNEERKVNCYAVMWSWGLICVHCGCCSKDPLTRTRARIRYNEELLKEREEFDAWVDDPEGRAIQEQVIETDIRYFKRRLYRLRRRLKELEGAEPPKT